MKTTWQSFLPAGCSLHSACWFTAGNHKYGSEEIRTRKAREVFYTQRMRIHEKAFEWNMAHIISFCLLDRAVCHGQERARESGLSGQTISSAFPSGWIDIRILQAITHDNCTAYWILGNFLTFSYSVFFYICRNYHMQSLHSVHFELRRSLQHRIRIFKMSMCLFSLWLRCLSKLVRAVR